MSEAKFESTGGDGSVRSSEWLPGARAQGNDSRGRVEASPVARPVGPLDLLRELHAKFSELSDVALDEMEGADWEEFIRAEERHCAYLHVATITNNAIQQIRTTGASAGAQRDASEPGNNRHEPDGGKAAPKAL